MYLLRLYQHSKVLFAAIVLLATAQLFINYKHGVVLSPFYHFGMYSATMPVENRYEIWNVEVDGKILKGADYSTQQWDEILLPLQYYAGINASNSLFTIDAQRLLAHLHINANETCFLQPCNGKQFQQWYKKYLQNILGTNVRSVAVYRKVFVFNQGRLQPTDSLTPLSQLCR